MAGTKTGIERLAYIFRQKVKLFCNLCGFFLIFMETKKNLRKLLFHFILLAK